jgi:hypothetical protein
MRDPDLRDPGPGPGLDGVRDHQLDGGASALNGVKVFLFLLLFVALFVAVLAGGWWIWQHALQPYGDPNQ